MKLFQPLKKVYSQSIDEMSADFWIQRLNRLFYYAEYFEMKELAEQIKTRINDTGDTIYIMVVGTGNLGKSSLINALLGSKIAPVDICPKTWIIDIYKTTEDNPYAELVWDRNNARIVEKVTIEEARKICNDIENKLKQTINESENEMWKSDLREVRWYFSGNWPKQNWAVIDTPGIDQNRMNTSLKNINLYGASGVQIERTDSFSYYFDKADLVLWCIDSARINTKDALEKLELVGKTHKSRMICTVTRSDRYWDDIDQIIGKAASEFSDYFNNIVPTIAKSDHPLSAQTIDNLKKIIENILIGKEISIKTNALQTIFIQRQKEYLEISSSILQIDYNNLIAMNKTIKFIENTSDQLNKKIETEMRNIKTTARNALNSYLSDIWEVSNGSVEVFENRLNQSIQNYHVENDLNRINDLLSKHINWVNQTILGSQWKTVQVGQRHVKHSEVSGQLVSSLSVYSMGKVSSLHINTDTVFGTSVKIGGVAAIIGVVALGPLGLVAGGIGFLANYFMKGEKCKDSGKNHILKYLNDVEKNFMTTANQSLELAKKQANAALKNMLSNINGADHTKILQRSEALEFSLIDLNTEQTAPNNPIFLQFNSAGVVGDTLYYHKFYEYFNDSPNKLQIHNVDKQSAIILDCMQNATANIDSYINKNLDKIKNTGGTKAIIDSAFEHVFPRSIDQFIINQGLCLVGLLKTSNVIYPSNLDGNYQIRREKQYSIIGMIIAKKIPNWDSILANDTKKIVMHVMKIHQLTDFYKIVDEWDEKVQIHFSLYTKSRSITYRVDLFNFYNYLKYTKNMRSIAFFLFGNVDWDDNSINCYYKSNGNSIIKELNNAIRIELKNDIYKCMQIELKLSKRWNGFIDKKIIEHMIDEIDNYKIHYNNKEKFYKHSIYKALFSFRVGLWKKNPEKTEKVVKKLRYWNDPIGFNTLSSYLEKCFNDVYVRNSMTLLTYDFAFYRKYAKSLFTSDFDIIEVNDYNHQEKITNIFIKKLNPLVEQYYQLMVKNYWPIGQQIISAFTISSALVAIDNYIFDITTSSFEIFLYSFLSSFIAYGIFRFIKTCINIRRGSTSFFCEIHNELKNIENLAKQ